MARKKKVSKNTMLVLGLVGGALVVGVVFMVLNFQGLLTVGPSSTPGALITFNATDYATGEALDVNILRYDDDATNLDLDDVADLTYSSFAIDATGDEDMEFEPIANFNYWFKINKTGFITEWYYYYGKGAPASDVGSPLILGENSIFLMNITESASILMYNSTLGTNFADGENATDFDADWTNTDRDWSVVVKVDTDETDSDYKIAEGLKLAYDFENDWWNRTIIQITYNTTAQTAWARVNNWANYEAVSGNVTYIGVDAAITGTTTFDLRFNANMGSTYYIRSVSIMYGDYSGSPRLFSTQD
jgi:hypothetical protein